LRCAGKTHLCTYYQNGLSDSPGVYITVVRKHGIMQKGVCNVSSANWNY